MKLSNGFNFGNPIETLTATCVDLYGTCALPDVGSAVDGAIDAAEIVYVLRINQPLRATIEAHNLEHHASEIINLLNHPVVKAFHAECTDVETMRDYFAECALMNFHSFEDLEALALKSFNTLVNTKGIESLREKIVNLQGSWERTACEHHVDDLNKLCAYINTILDRAN